MKNLKTTMIAVMLMLAAVGEVVAQDKCDFIMAYLDNVSSKHPVIHLIQNDVAVKVIETGKKLTDGVGQYERLLSTISQLTAEGWEVISISGYTFY
jgi:hypothetical protein